MDPKKPFVKDTTSLQLATKAESHNQRSKKDHFDEEVSFWASGILFQFL